MKKLLEEGDVIDITVGHKVRYCGNCIRIENPSSRPIGRYAVYKVTFDGGGRDHNSYYSDGHHVFCERIDDPTVRVDFWQSGDFNAMIEDIKPIGKAKRKWEVELYE